jgi:hypothetical protein
MGNFSGCPNFIKFLGWGKSGLNSLNQNRNQKNTA